MANIITCRCCGKKLTEVDFDPANNIEGEIKPLERKEEKTFTNECPAPYTEQAANNESPFLLALLGEI